MLKQELITIRMRCLAMAIEVIIKVPSKVDVITLAKEFEKYIILKP